jgi:hypothetical protein
MHSNKLQKIAFILSLQKKTFYLFSSNGAKQTTSQLYLIEEGVFFLMNLLLNKDVLQMSDMKNNIC